MHLQKNTDFGLDRFVRVSTDNAGRMLDDAVSGPLVTDYTIFRPRGFGVFRVGFALIS